LQSLTLMNDKFMLDNADYLAERAGEMTGKDAPAAKKIEAAYLLALSRKPAAAEVKLGEEFLAKQRELYVGANETPLQAEAKSFASLAHMLLSSNEFLYVD